MSRAFIVVGLLVVVIVTLVVAFLTAVPANDRRVSDAKGVAGTEPPGQDAKGVGIARPAGVVGAPRNGESNPAHVDSSSPVSDSSPTATLDRMRELLAVRQGQLDGLFACMPDLLSDDSAAVEQLRELLDRESIGDEASATRADVRELLETLAVDRPTIEGVLGAAFSHVAELTDFRLVVDLAEWLREHAGASRVVSAATALTSAVASVSGPTLEQRRFLSLIGSTPRDALWTLGSLDVRAAILLLDACGVSWVETARFVYAAPRALIAPFQTIDCLEREHEAAVIPYLNGLGRALDEFATIWNPRISPHAGIRPALEAAIIRLGGALPSLDEAIDEGIASGDRRPLDMAEPAWIRYIEKECTNLAEMVAELWRVLGRLPEDDRIRGNLADLNQPGARAYWRRVRELCTAGEFQQRARDEIPGLFDLLSQETDPWRLYTIGSLLVQCLLELADQTTPEQFEEYLGFLRAHLGPIPPGKDPWRKFWVANSLHALYVLDRPRALIEYEYLAASHWQTVPIVDGVFLAVEGLVRGISDGFAPVLTSAERRSIRTINDVAFSAYLQRDTQDSWLEHLGRCVRFACKTVRTLEMRDLVPTLEAVREHAQTLDDSRTASYADQMLEQLAETSHGD